MNLRAMAGHWTNVFKASVDEQPILFFTLMTLALIWIGQIGLAHQVLFTGFLRDTDDAMRLAEVRDLLAGQNWFDLKQYRLDPPRGVLMHWSRLIDAPIAGLILLFDLFTERVTAERIARFVWPALLQAGLAVSLLALTKQLAGRIALFPAAVFIGFGWIISTQFEPGRIDHHSAQLFLSAFLVVLIYASERNAVLAFFAGTVVAVMAAIGFESLAVIVIAGLYLLLLWIFMQMNARRRLRFFGLGLGLSAIVIYLLTTPAHLYSIVFCDAQSFLSALALAGAGAGAVVLTFIGQRLNAPLLRTVAALALGLVLTAVLAPFAQDCLSGPFAALPEDLQKNWLDKVSEAIGLVGHLKGDFWATIPFAGPLLVCLLCAYATFYFMRKDRWRWGLVVTLAAVHVALTFQHLRMISFACLFAVPACAWCVVRLREKQQLAMALLYIACIPAFWALLNTWFGKPPEPAKTDCNTPANFSALAALPKATLLAPADFGPHLLAYTPHSVYGAPYHRNVEGMRFSYNTLYSNFKTAIPLLRDKKPTYLVLCDGIGELKGIDKQAPETLAARLLRGDKLQGLKKLNLKTPLLVWQIDYSALPAR